MNNKMIKKLIIVLSLMFVTLGNEAKTTYIPHYNSYILLETADGETTTENSLKVATTMFAKDKSFRLSIVHEEMTAEKVKSIKRAKNAAGWKAAAAILSSVAAMTDRSPETFQSRLSLASQEIALELAEMYTKNAQAEQVLKIEVQFENLSDREMMLHDMERGLVWFVRPGKDFVMQLHNPDALLLRISDAKDITSNVYYASLAGGNSVEKVDVTYENDEYILSVQKGTSDAMYSNGRNETDRFWYIDKQEFVSRRIDEQEFKKLRGAK